MREYLYDEIEIGQTESFEVKITQEMVEAFCALSGDLNPLHTNLDFAKESGYDACVVYGMVTASFLSTLAGVYLPGKWCLLQEVKTSFATPVFVGDTLSITGKVVKKHDTFKQIEIKARIVNQNSKCVCRATVKAGVLK